MHGIARVTSTALAFMVVAGNAAAQTCMGRPAFSTARSQLGAVAQFGNDALVLGGELSLGKDRGLFGRVGAAYERHDANGLSSNPSGWIFAGALGYQLQAGSTGRLHICPVVSADWGKIKFGEGSKLRRSEARVGTMVGLAGTGARFVPFGGLAFAQLSRDEEVEGSSDVSLGTDTYFPLTLGVGWHKRVFALVGDVTFPLDLGDADPTFAIRLLIPFGLR